MKLPQLNIKLNIVDNDGSFSIIAVAQFDGTEEGDHYTCEEIVKHDESLSIGFGYPKLEYAEFTEKIKRTISTVVQKIISKREITRVEKEELKRLMAKYPELK